MSEEWPSMKRVKCGCGGNGVLNTGHIIAATGEYLANVKCDKCGIATRVCVNMDMAEATVEAVESWNTAMGNRDNLTLIERTAKVVNKQIDVSRNRWGKCGKCGSLVFSNYCPACGAHLIWDDEDIPMEYFESGGK